MARLGEKLRQGADLEHWAAFPESFTRLVTRLGEVAAGKHGAAPSTVLILSGDVHHSYVAPVHLPGRPLAERPGSAAGDRHAPRSSRSPAPRCATPSRARSSGPSGWPTRARPAGSARCCAAACDWPRPPVDWQLSTGPLYGNGVGSLRISGDTMVVRLERAELRGEKGTLHVRHEEQIRGRPGARAAG